MKPDKLQRTAVLLVRVLASTVRHAITALSGVVAVRAATTRKLVALALEAVALVAAVQRTVPHVVAVLAARIALRLAPAARELAAQTNPCVKTPRRLTTARVMFDIEQRNLFPGTSR